MHDGRSTASTASGPAATRCRRPARSAPGSRAAASWSPRSPPSASSATHPAERAMVRRVEAAAGRASSPRRPSARPAASSPGCWRRGSARSEDSRAAGARDRRLGPARGDRPRRPRRRRARPRPRLQALRRGHAAGEARGGGEAAAAALPDRGRRALGRRRRSAASTTRCAATSARRPRGRRPRGGRRATSPPTASTATTSSTREELRGAARPTRAGGPARSSPACARGEIRRDPGPRRGLRGHDVCPAFCDFAPICRRDRAPRSSRGRRKRRSGERARARPPEQAAAIEAGGRDVLVEAGAGTGKTGVMVDRYCRLVCERRRLPRRDPRLHLHRQGGGRAAPADPRRARAAGRGRLGARRASCWPRSAAPG